MSELKNASISVRILDKLKSGDSLETAIDLELGAGTYDNMVEELYNELRSKAKDKA